MENEPSGSGLMSFFRDHSPLSPTSPVIKRLSELIKRHDGTRSANEECKWEEKAVRSLIKKLKRDKGTLEDLERSIITEDPTTPCIAIPRSLDGRLQVSQRKGLPHVMYCRMWRWPDLQSQHQIVSIPDCKYPFSRKLDHVCVNPMHFERINALEPIMVPKSLSSSHGGEAANQPSTSTAHARSSEQPSTSTNPPPEPQPHSAADIDRMAIFPDNVTTASPTGALVPAPATMNTSSALNEDTEMTDTNELASTMSSPFGSDVPSPLLTRPPVGTDSIAIDYIEQPYWCSISYYELNQRVGDTFHASQQSVTVDGFCAPSDSERFCLGQLSNVNRNIDVTEARKHIGPGARFYVIGHEIMAECLSESPIFVQSPNCNHRNGWHPGTVAKIPPNSYWKIFDQHDFAELLRNSVPQGFEAVYSLTRMCTIRVSFVKGWGADYRRQTITATPCWIELHLNGPLKWLDRVWQQMRSPLNCHSDT